LVKSNFVNEYELIQKNVSFIDEDISHEDYKDWIKHPLTILFFNWVFKKKIESQESIFFNAENTQSTYKSIGAVQAYEDVINKFKEL